MARGSRSRRCVALLSGGLDSTVALALRARDAALAVTVDYGQRAAIREVAAAWAIAKRLRVPHRLIRLPDMAAVTGTALVHRRSKLPSPDLSSARSVRASAKSVWVPNRNGVFINLAAMLAEAMGAGEVVVGFNREEAATFPDNGVAFLRAATRALHYSTSNGIRVVSPTALWNKRRIVREGRRIGAPLDLIWPCYEGGRTWCRRCESCLRSLRALA